MPIPFNLPFPTIGCLKPQTSKKGVLASLSEYYSDGRGPLSGLSPLIKGCCLWRSQILFQSVLFLKCLSSFPSFSFHLCGNFLYNLLCKKCNFKKKWSYIWSINYVLFRALEIYIYNFFQTIEKLDQPLPLIVCTSKLYCQCQSGECIIKLNQLWVHSSFMSPH
jgi:hypothetical protein